MLVGDDSLNCCRLDLSNDSPEGNLSFKFEHLSFFKGSVVSEPVVYCLE